jgi:pimeloyl-ACP methyl ester carboxylesterase
MPAPDATPAFEEIRFASRDGLRLYARHYRAPGSDRMPAVCLPGLTRNSRDFHDLARALSRGTAARDVYTLDYRGRGLSETDPYWRNYTIVIEANDVLDFLTLTGLEHAAMIGTSRGGLITMVMAALRPTVIGAAVLNDIGPVIEVAGLTRIAGYAGRTPVPSSWELATALVAEFNARSFPAVPQSLWAEVARQWFNEKNGRPAAGYDPRLGRTLSVATPPPVLWPQFQGLLRAPLLVIRGETSDLLSAATVAEMQRRHPNCATMVVAGQGHAPLLKDEASIGAIARFLAAVESGHSVAGLELSLAA